MTKEQRINRNIEIREIYKNKKDYYGFLHTLSNDDKRIIPYHQQYEKYGFDPTVTWSLYNKLAEFILPRLEEFKRCTGCYPPSFKSLEEWFEIIDKMIFAFDHISKDTEEDTTEIWEKVKEGLDLFRQYFFHFWN